MPSLDQMHPFAVAGRASEMSAVLGQSRYALSSPARVYSPVYGSITQAWVLQELMKLPAVSLEVLGSFEQAFSAKRSEKDQRNLIRKLLFNSGESHAEGRSAIAARQRHSGSGMALQCSPVILSSALLYLWHVGVYVFCTVYLTGCMVSCACASILEHCS